MRSYGGATLLNKYKGLVNLLRNFVPEFKSSSAFRFQVFKSQHLLRDLVKQFLPYNEIYVNFHHDDLVFSHSNRFMELDIFLPQLSLAFEFQGQQHYSPNSLFGILSVEKYQHPFPR